MRTPRPIIAVLLLILAFFGPASGFVHAMTISPPEFNLTVNPGDVIKDVLHVYNEDPYPATLRATILNLTFRPGDEFGGAPDFYPADVTRDGHELAPWITLDTDPSFTIAPAEWVNIPFTITVPGDAQPGGHFGAVHVGTLQEPRLDENPHLGITAMTGALLFVRVRGEARDELSVEQFFSKRYVQTHLPADLTIRVSNKGTTHAIPAGNIFVTDVFGRQVASIKVNEEKQRRVLPGSMRRFDVSWQRTPLPKDTPEHVQQWRNFAFGRYTATLVLNYGNEDQQKLLSATTTFWVIPWMVLLTALLAAALMIFLGRLLLMKYERGVIRRYESSKHESKL